MADCFERPALSSLAAELRNAITPALCYLEMIDDAEAGPRPEEREVWLRRIEGQLDAVEHLSREIAATCRAALEA